MFDFTEQQRPEVIKHILIISRILPIQMSINKGKHTFMLSVNQGRVFLMDPAQRLPTKEGQLVDVENKYLTQMLMMCTRLGRPWPGGQ